MGKIASRIIRAHPEQAELISGLAFRSKAYWGYSDEFMEACRQELAYSQQEIEDADCYYLCENNVIAGFYILRKLTNKECELDALYVDPIFIGKCVGRTLVDHAKSIATEMGVKKMMIQSDPNAMGFYLSAGAVQIGVKESGSIAGRYLPMLEICIS